MPKGPYSSTRADRRSPAEAGATTGASANSRAAPTRRAGAIASTAIAHDGCKPTAARPAIDARTGCFRFAWAAVPQAAVYSAAAGGRAPRRRFAQQQQQRRRQQHDQHHQLEIVDIGHHLRLPRRLGIERGEPGGSCQAVGRRQIRRLGQRVVGPQMLDKAGMHGLGVLGQQRHDDRDADAAADIAHQAEDRGPLGQDVPRQGRERDDAERRKDKAEAEPLQYARRDDRSHPHLQREAGHLPDRHRGQQQAPSG